jgi:hypothetical protein
MNSQIFELRTDRSIEEDILARNVKPIEDNFAFGKLQKHMNFMKK